MDVSTSDPYELRLYEMFHSFDTDQSGYLNVKSLQKLCQLLELQNDGAVLISQICNSNLIDNTKDDRNTNKKTTAALISFAEFKEALLNFLGDTELDNNTKTTATGVVASTAATDEVKILPVKIATNITAATTTTKKATNYDDKIIDGNDELDEAITERILIIKDDIEVYADSTSELSDDRLDLDTKLLKVNKKYGRQTRLNKSDMENKPSTNDILGITDSDEGEDDGDSISDGFNKVQRSSSQTDIPSNGQSRHRPLSTLNGSGKLKRCASLPASQRNSKPWSKVNNDKMSTSLTTKKEQQQQQHGNNNHTNNKTKKQMSSSTESLDTQPPAMEILPTHSILDIWERANITNGRGILLALGFDDEEINVVQLCKVLEEELRNLDDESQLTFQKALIALQAAELTTLRQNARQLHGENVKLRADNKDANRRVAMLALEVDERHALLEDSSKKELRQLEQKHAGVVRELTQRMTNDREHWSNLTTRLEARIKNFEQEELKMKAEIELHIKENGELEKSQRRLQKQLTDLELRNTKLNQEIATLLENSKQREKSETDDEREEKATQNESFRHLLEKVAALQLENTNLRDKNDELVTEMENLNLEINRLKIKNKKALMTTSNSSSTMSNSFHEDALVDDSEHGATAATTATKRRGDSPSKTRIMEESPRLGKLRKCGDDQHSTSGENSDTSGEWMALNSELRDSEAAAATTSSDIRTVVAQSEQVEILMKKIKELEEELTRLRESVTVTSNDKTRTGTPPEERCKELETSLEQMQRAYEDCEDYWQSKLSEERQLFEKERQIYEEEQQESDRKFTELMEKVREYEEQFQKDGRLSPIEEKDTLEQQYIDLEAEAEQIRETARKMFEEKCKEIEELQSEIEDLRIRLGESVEILTGASELVREAVEKDANGVAAAQQFRNSNHQSPASSPINYLWQQSTIQEPNKHFSPIEQSTLSLVTVGSGSSSQRSSSNSRTNLSTTETSIFSTTLIHTTPKTNQNGAAISPIKKPSNTISSDASTITANVNANATATNAVPFETNQKHPETEAATIVAAKDSDRASTSSTISSSAASVKSSDTHGTTNNPATTTTTKTSTCSSPTTPTSPSGIKEELKRLKFFEISLRDQIKDLSFQRDGLVMELQQLQEAKPVLEKAYARTAHPSLIQRVNQLELRNRHLQNVIKQQQQYTESLMQQTWRQHQIELNDLHTRLEAQSAMLAEQAHRLQNADVLAKDLYVENSHLTATVQRLEQQQIRVNIMNQQQQQQQHQQHHQQLQQQQYRLPGMP